MQSFFGALIRVLACGPDEEGFRPLYTLNGDLNPEVRRGDPVRVHKDITGRFVGRSIAGVDWVVYDEDEAVFVTQCVNFDRKFAPRELM